MLRAHRKKRLCQARVRPQGAPLTRVLKTSGADHPGLLLTTSEEAELEQHVAVMTAVAIPESY